MTERKRPLLSGLRDELGSLAADVAESLKLRLELAQLELADDYRSGKRLSIVLLVALVLLLTSLPLFVASLADVLDGFGQISRAGWLLIFAAVLVLLAASGAFFAWRCFRRNLVAFQETIEELREDLLWLREWTSTDQSSPQTPAEREGQSE